MNDVRKRRLFRLWNNFLEHVAYLVVFTVFVYVFFIGPFFR